MKLWQLKNILSDEIEIYNRYFSSFQDYHADMPEALIIEALAKSRKIYLVTTEGWLRLTMPNNGPSSITKELPIVEAYKKYGGNAINEVIDYGSFKISKA